ncbi:MAG: glutamine-hydrolyzing GMP synthase [FCB group bacterium]|nr:glutamine-hydrolyzing GMP synthase [FCB group bacterium]
MTERQEIIVIIDFGSQYTQLIARRLREAKVYCEIHPFNTNIEKIRSLNPKGLVLSGGPASIYDDGAPQLNPEFLELGVPVLGICYGMHAVSDYLGGKVDSAERKEYGPADLEIASDSPLFHGMARNVKVWMSHGDHVTELPAGFTRTASAWNAHLGAAENREKRIFLVQFHPEVTHTPDGPMIIRNFAYEICGMSGNWTTEYFIERTVADIRAKLAGDKVLCALSGGVDSTVTAALLHKAVPGQVIPVFVDNGLLRFEDRAVIEETLIADLGIDVKIVDAGDKFLSKLTGITEPEDKRKIIGETFIRVFEEAAAEWMDVKYLAQGTLYPDVIESVSVGGPSATIKSHHNVGGLPEVMDLDLIEPLRELFKDEVRAVGESLGLPDSIVNRHPFPGPGLAVRILGEITPERLDILRGADRIFIRELRDSGWYQKVSQALCVLLPVKSVGVMGDARTYEYVLAMRSVNTVDFMTAQWSPIPQELLGKIANRIINEISGVNRVVYDYSTKPPATVEWE